MSQGDSGETKGAGKQAPGLPVRIVPDKLSIYYSNCAMVATTPVDISLYFGRYVQTNSQEGQGLAELYERQIYMTLEQAKKLSVVLNQTIQSLEAQRTPPAQPVQQRQTSAAPAAPARTAPAAEAVRARTAAAPGQTEAPAARPQPAVIRKPPQGSGGSGA